MAGKTLDEAKAALEKQLSQYFDSPEVSLKVAAYNSKVYYVMVEGAGRGDHVIRIPATGNETVLDAISFVSGLSTGTRSPAVVPRPRTTRSCRATGYSSRTAPVSGSSCEPRRLVLCHA